MFSSVCLIDLLWFGSGIGSVRFGVRFGVHSRTRRDGADGNRWGVINLCDKTKSKLLSRLQSRQPGWERQHNVGSLAVPSCTPNGLDARVFDRDVDVADHVAVIGDFGVHGIESRS